MHWGWSALSPRSKRSCGVMILLSRKRFPHTSCGRVFTPRNNMWRRGGAIRLATRHSDLLLMSLCFSPKTNSGVKDAARYRATVQEIVRCATKVIDEGPHRTLPILGLDLNDGLGLEKERRIKSDALSAGCCRDEGHARKLFREMMEQQKMVRSQWTLPTSRYLPRPARRTDFDRLHLAPSVLRWLNHQGRAFHSGRTLQHGAVRRSLDHDPVLVRFAFAPDVFRPPQPEMVRLDMDLLDEDGLSKGGIHGKSRSRRKRGRSR